MGGDGRERERERERENSQSLRMSTSEAMVEILQNIWSKLQAFPQEHPLTQAAFIIIILFSLTFIIMLVVGCVYSCCGCCVQGTRNRVSSL
ncbi:hypothetical protein DNTS_023461 [Danionella cerebrum]|uniref:Small integral membrane protein 5 n=1 Tax=Danionella cerebrum TaxID=2873325 RepID=A0A553NLH4_9TELE|nr:hypothetical protein DNTS_023461 [Danionella translucida]